MENLADRWYQQLCKQMSATKLVIYIFILYMQLIFIVHTIYIIILFKTHL
jgi:hypothetical protein